MLITSEISQARDSEFEYDVLITQKFEFIFLLTERDRSSFVIVEVRQSNGRKLFETTDAILK